MRTMILAVGLMALPGLCHAQPVDPNACNIATGTINTIQSDLVDICESAKAAEASDLSNRAGSLMRMSGLLMKLNADASRDPYGAAPESSEIITIGQDYQSLGAEEVIYASSGSEGDWSSVQDILENLTSDAQVTGN